MSNTKPNALFKQRFEHYPVLGIKWNEGTNVGKRFAMTIEDGDVRVLIFGNHVTLGDMDNLVGQIYNPETKRWQALLVADIPVLQRLAVAATYNTFVRPFELSGDVMEIPNIGKFRVTASNLNSVLKNFIPTYAPGQAASYTSTKPLNEIDGLEIVT